MMGRCLAWFAAALAVLGAASARGPDRSRSCSTFVLERGAALLVGHNLDEYVAVPGLIVANARGLAKENVTFADILSASRTGSVPRLKWVSRFGSVTYNVFGREFPDGGLNEAGLYVGEMTLAETVWPANSTAALLNHNQWIQYLLDNFATVDEALASLDRALPEGNCKWHFLLADRKGGAAVIEFIKGEPVVYAAKNLPYKILCNDPYDAELKDLANYEGFGGAKKPAPQYEREDPRFRWAAVKLRDYRETQPAAKYAFAVLDRLNMGNRKWAVVCDLAQGRLYVRTSLAPKVRWIDLAALDFACAKPVRALDIHQDLEGDLAGHFAPLTAAWNQEAIEKAWAEIDMGAVGNLHFKPRIVRGLAAASAAFYCQEGR